MNGILDACSAWARVFSSRFDAQFMSRLRICSIESTLAAVDLGKANGSRLAAAYSRTSSGWSLLKPARS
jgi:hypothetical protein